MKRQGSYSEYNGSPRSMQQQVSSSFDRTQQHSVANYFSGRPSSLSADGAPLRKSAKVEWLWQLERETAAASPASSQIPSHDEVLGSHGTNGVRSYYTGGQPSGSSSHLEEHACKEPNPPPQPHHELDMEIGYEDDRPMSLTLESVEQKFSDEFTQLVKEQKDAEDAEHTRHLERIIEINKEYKEKWSALRAQQVESRREFFDKETREHYQQQQQQHPQATTTTKSMSRSSPHPTPTPTPTPTPVMMGYQDARGAYSYYPTPPSTVGPLYDHHHPHHGSGVNELLYNRDRPPQQQQQQQQQLPLSGSGRAPPHQPQAMEGRVPLPAGRVYNNTAASRYH